jgi:YHS domain-containing protein
MKTRMILAAALAAAAFVLAGSLSAEDKPTLKCPVSGKPVNPASTVSFDGGTVAFCCDNCPKAFEADKAKYAAKAHLQMAQSGQLKQVKCPLTGKAINAEMAVNVEGVQVGLCCKNCKAKIDQASPSDQVNLLFKDTSKGFEVVKK